MKTDKKPAGFQFRIELREILPPVWRRFLVPGAIALPGLHRVIQEVMGWENYHLHIFRFGEKEYGVPDPDYPTEMRNEKGRGKGTWCFSGRRHHDPRYQERFLVSR